MNEIICSWEDKRFQEEDWHLERERGRYKAFLDGKNNNAKEYKGQIIDIKDKSLGDYFFTIVILKKNTGFF